MELIRVLIVDDSFFMRKLLRELLESDESITVIDEVNNGAEAVAKIKQLKPDVVTLDYHLTDTTGAEVAKQVLQGEGHKPGIVMISAYTKEGAEETMECLRAGVVDVVAKPSGELSLDIDKIKHEILRKVHIASKAKIRIHGRNGKRISKPRFKAKEIANKVVIIGSSTGGPPVVEDILSELPKDLPAAIIIVQHMPPYFTRTFPIRLNKISELDIKEGQENDILKTGQVLVAPGDYHLRLRQKGESEVIVNLTKEDPCHGLRPAIDHTMEDVARIYGSNTIAVILSGMGEDGAKGCVEIKRAGGYVIVQDPKTTVVPSMPEETINKGVVDEIVKPCNIAEKIIDLCK